MLIVGQKIIFNRIWRISVKSYPFTHAFLGVRFKVVRESAVHGLQEGHRDYNSPVISTRKKNTAQECAVFFVVSAQLCSP